VTQGSASSGWRRCRRAKARVAPFPAEQAPRSPQQDRHRQKVNDERTELGQQVFKAGVGDADQQRRDKRPADAAEPANRDDNQEVDQIIQRVTRADRQQIGAETAAETGKPATEREGQRKQARGVNTDRLRHPQIVDSSADPDAEAGAFEAEPKQGYQRCPAQDQKAAKRRKAAEAEIDLASQPARRLHRLWRRPPDIGHRRHRHENQPDRQQHLVELVAAIKPAVEKSLDHDAAERRQDGCSDERQAERHAVPVDEASHDIAAQHRKDAVCEIDKAHHPHRH